MLGPIFSETRKASETRGSLRLSSEWRRPAEWKLYRMTYRYQLTVIAPFQDVYDWAGELRTIDIAKQGDLFCLAPFVGTELAKRFEAIGAEDYLMGLSESQFATRAAEHLSELNAIHPFREGNGRTLRAFLSILADQAGHPIDLVRISPSDWNAASIESFRRGDARPLRDAVANAISSSR